MPERQLTPPYPKLRLDQLPHGLLPIVFHLYCTPLCSPGEIAGFLNATLTSCYELLRELTKTGWVRTHYFGWSKSRAQRYWLSRPTVEALIDAKIVRGYGWYSERRMRSLIRRFSVLESCYSVAADPEITRRLGAFAEFLWLPDLRWDAAVRYERGWVELTWSGEWESAKHLRCRMESYWRAIKVRTDNDTTLPILPSITVFVVPDAWQVQVVSKCLEWVPTAYGVLIYQVDQKKWHPYRDTVHDQASWLDVPAINSVLGLRQRFADVEKLLADTDLLDCDSILIGKLQSQSEQWPGALRNHLKDLTNDNSKRVAEKLQWLENRGLVRTVAVQKEDPKQADREVRPHWCPTEKTLVQAARRDRVEPSVPKGRVGQYGNDDWYAKHWMRHEIGLMRLIAGFRRAEFEIASGWRGMEDFGESGQLSPDAMVREPDEDVLGIGPVAGKWFYVEYELSAQSAARWERKIRAYWNPRRRFPGMSVMCVCRNERAEETLHGQWVLKADEHTHTSRPGKLITTTVGRLKRYGPMDQSVWRDNEGPCSVPSYRAVEDAFVALCNAYADQYRRHNDYRPTSFATPGAKP